MNTSCPVCGLPPHPETDAVATVAGYLTHAGACAATLTAALRGTGRGQP